MSFEGLFSRRAAGVHLDLEVVRRAHALLDAPAARTPAVHMLGTNGKGSTAAMCAHALMRAGHRVGLYTSPHLVSVTERVRIDGAAVPERELQGATASVLAIEAELDPKPRPLSFFEVLTLAAALVFARHRVDVIVAEAGLGGRLDATRIFEARVHAFTSIDLDHQAWLGDTLDAIATEKAAVMRQGVPAITAPQHPAVMDVLRRRAESVGATLREAAPLPAPPRGLVGEHQRVNGAVALLAARVIAPRLTAADLDGVDWPGRLETLRWAGGRVILDVAHNPAGIRCVVEHVRAMRPSTLAVLFGCMQDKDARAMVEALETLEAPLWLTTPGEGGWEPAAPSPRARARVFATLDDPALRSTLHHHLARGGTVLACGSHVLVGKLRAEALGTPRDPDPSDPMRTRDG